jgi:hypothetical protein
MVRTTLDLPDKLLKRVKIVAIKLGVTLRELVESALTKNLEVMPEPEPVNQKIGFPIFSSAQPGSLELTDADIAHAEVEEDLRRLCIPR